MEKIIAILTLAVFFLQSLPAVKPANAQTAVKVMPLGDSITDGHSTPGSYRTDLYQKGIPIDFVGSQSNGPASLPDKNHEGHLGWEIDGIKESVVGWLNAYQPDYVMLLIGTNDVNRSRDLANAPARLSSLIDTITNTIPNVRLLVGSIPPIGDSGANSRAIAYNSAIPGIVSQKQSQGRHVYFVDIYSVMSASDNPDGVHPNAIGFSKMANAWFSVFAPLVNGSSPSPTLSPTPEATPSTPGDANMDNKVDGLDYIIWLNHYGQAVAQGAIVGDSDANGEVDGLDYIIWVINYS